MLRYVVIGAIVGFAVSVLLLSRGAATPAEAPPPTPPGIQTGPTFPRGAMSDRAELQLPQGGPRLRMPTIRQQLMESMRDAGAP